MSSTFSHVLEVEIIDQSRVMRVALLCIALYVGGCRSSLLRFVVIMPVIFQDEKNQNRINHQPRFEPVSNNRDL